MLIKQLRVTFSILLWKHCMFSKRSDKKELLDNLNLSDFALIKNLNELDVYNHYLGGINTLINALNEIYRKRGDKFNNKIIIADLGCGSGELLRVMADWAKTKNVELELIGIDANCHVILHAINKSQQYPTISYQVIDIFSPEFAAMQFDIVTINSVTHHFTDAALVDLFKSLSKQTNLAIIVNDLQRHWFSYYFIKYITMLPQFSYLVKHDAPLSVLRAFTKHELEIILKQADISDYELRWAWAFRWKLIIWC